MIGPKEMSHKKILHVSKGAAPYTPRSKIVISQTSSNSLRPRMNFSTIELLRNKKSACLPTGGSILSLLIKKLPINILMGPIGLYLIKSLTFIIYNFQLYKNPTMVDYQQDYDRVDHNEEDYDADDALLQGSNKTRRFTDVFCFVMFAVAIIGFFAVMAITGGKGDLSKVAIPVDRNGNLCGRDNGTSGDFTNYKWLYLNPNDIANNASLSFKNRVCVMSCPYRDERIKCPPDAYGSYCNDSGT
jgi:hypothetical protein